MRYAIPFFLIALSFSCKGREPASSAPSQPAGVANAPTTATSSSQLPVTSTESAVAPEVNPVGDIPDSQAFVVYDSQAGGYSLDVPEGWARSENGANVSFIGKLDGVGVTLATSTSAPTAATAREHEARDIQQRGRAVQINEVKDVNLPNGLAVLIKFGSNSDPNAVTGKQLRQENETYLYFKNGREAALTLWAPQGADNADQWQRMSKSFRWK
jgi:hypothetical protein